MMGIMQEKKKKKKKRPQMANPTIVFLASQRRDSLGNTSKFESRNFSTRSFLTLVSINNDVETKSESVLSLFRGLIHGLVSS